MVEKRAPSWWSSSLPTTAAGVERGVALLTSGLRIGILAQMIPSVHAGVTESPRPALYLTLWIVAAVTLVGFSVLAVIKGRGHGPVTGAIDIGIACALLIAGPAVIDEEHRIGTWIGYAPGYSLTVLISVIGVRGLVQWIASTAAIIVSYVLFLDSALDDSSVFGALGNILTYVCASVGRVALSYIRRIARDADDSRARAAELGRREEERRAQLAMHNGVVIMRMLTDPDLTDAARQQLLDQSISEINRMRSYLRSAPRSTAEAVSGDVALTSVVRRVHERFGDLPIESVLDLGAGIEIATGDAAALEHALDSLLLNVREHADADQVVIHLDVEPDGRWSLTVSDNGAGFEPDLDRAGVGLREVVVGQLGRRGMDVDIDSTVGDGTIVTILGPRVQAGELTR